MVENALCGDAQEGISAFLQKRSPNGPPGILNLRLPMTDETAGFHCGHRPSGSSLLMHQLPGFDEAARAGGRPEGAGGHRRGRMAMTRP